MSLTLQCNNSEIPLEMPLRGCSLDCIHQKAVTMQERASRLEHGLSISQIEIYMVVLILGVIS